MIRVVVQYAKKPRRPCVFTCWRIYVPVILSSAVAVACVCLYPAIHTNYLARRLNVEEADYGSLVYDNQFTKADAEMSDDRGNFAAKTQTFFGMPDPFLLREHRQWGRLKQTFDVQAKDRPAATLAIWSQRRTPHGEVVVLEAFTENGGNLALRLWTIHSANVFVAPDVTLERVSVPADCRLLEMGNYVRGGLQLYCAKADTTNEDLTFRARFCVGGKTGVLSGTINQNRSLEAHVLED